MGRGKSVRSVVARGDRAHTREVSTAGQTCSMRPGTSGWGPSAQSLGCKVVAFGCELVTGRYESIPGVEGRAGLGEAGAGGGGGSGHGRKEVRPMSSGLKRTGLAQVGEVGKGRRQVHRSIH